MVNYEAVMHMLTSKGSPVEYQEELQKQTLLDINVLLGSLSHLLRNQLPFSNVQKFWSSECLDVVLGLPHGRNSMGMPLLYITQLHITSTSSDRVQYVN